MPYLKPVSALFLPPDEPLVKSQGRAVCGVGLYTDIWDVPGICGVHNCILGYTYRVYYVCFFSFNFGRGLVGLGWRLRASSPGLGLIVGFRF